MMTWVRANHTHHFYSYGTRSKSTILSAVIHHSESSISRTMVLPHGSAPRLHQLRQFCHWLRKGGRWLSRLPTARWARDNVPDGVYIIWFNVAHFIMISLLCYDAIKLGIQYCSKISVPMSSHAISSSELMRNRHHVWEAVYFEMILNAMSQILLAFYKLDWKVCFLQWATQNRAMAAYHAFVEDDSFLCTAHLLHLTTLLKNLDLAVKHKPFRTGMSRVAIVNTCDVVQRSEWDQWDEMTLLQFSRWTFPSAFSPSSYHYSSYFCSSTSVGFHKLDGFDDSSTFMSREVAEAFANHYPSKVRIR